VRISAEASFALDEPLVAKNPMEKRSKAIVLFLSKKLKIQIVRITLLINPQTA